MAYNFKAAEQSGLNEQAIRAYLSSKGRQAEADAYYKSSSTPTLAPSTIDEATQSVAPKPQPNAVESALFGGQRFVDTGLGKVTNAVVSSEKKAGEDIGTAIQMQLPSVKAAFANTSEANKQLSQTFDAVLKKRHEMAIAGKDTSSLDEVLKEDAKILGVTNLQELLPPAAKKTSLQILGDFGGVALDAFTAGTLAKGAKSWSLLSAAEKAKLAEIGITDAAKATSYMGKLGEVGMNTLKDAAKGGAIGYGYDVTGSLQEGQDASTAAKPGTGTLLGISLPVAVGLFQAGKITASELTQHFQDIKKSVLKTRTSADVLATPETDLHKLNPEERKFYFENQKAALGEKSKALESKVQTDLTNNLAAGQKEAEDLQRNLAVASRDEVVKLRPKIVQSFGKQSSEYRRLVEEELAPHKDTGIFNDELSSFIDSKYAQNPEQAQAIKGKLGVPDVVKSPDGLPTINTGEPDTTIGDIYDKVKAMKQGMASGAKKGNRVFTPDEKLTDDAVSNLVDFMKSKGVDLQKAREFWAKYAPVRDQLITEAKPFLQTDTKTKTFANTISRVIQGNDVNNENFISEVEKLVGEPIGKAQKDIVKKLGDNEKKAIADKISAELEKDSISLAKEEAMKKLSEQEFEVARKARQRDIVKKIILAAGGFGLAGEIKKYTGIGF